MVARHIRTETILPASPERVWAVLADFSRYSEWNPLNTSAAGLGRMGERVRMTIANPLNPRRPMRMTVRIMRFKPERLLVWAGEMPFVFRGEHVFRLDPAPEGTRLLHTETITGLITHRITDRAVTEKFVPAYDAANRALAARVSETTLSA